MESSSGSYLPAQQPVPKNLLVHGIVMVILTMLVYIVHWLLGLTALVQFLWMLFLRERNVALAEFGEGLANWLAATARFLSGVADVRPFPWTSWNRR